MKLENITQSDDSTISFDVYINGSSDFDLTSYQCALTFNKYITDGKLSFNYVKGSSDLENAIPSFGIGINNIDGAEKLTFASMPGEDQISGKDYKVGEFKLTTSTKFTDSQPDLDWSFNGNVKTIVTGKDFDDNTDSLNHNWIVNGIVPIIKITASLTSDTSTSVNYLTDGQTASSDNPNSRWEADAMPVYLILDLGQLTHITQTNFAFAAWDKGRIYHYSVSFSTDEQNWNRVIYDAPSAAKEYTTDTYSNISARYVKLDILDNNQNNVANVWETQVIGSTDSSLIKSIHRFDNTITNINPNEFELLQNYPNPFNPSTKISFNLAQNGKVNLEVYNILGQKVKTLIDQDMIKGQHEVVFNADNLASGVYIYRLNVNDKYSAVKKMMLLK
jgi:F5/8 type C domain/Secretion system C-terminal sorting domain